MPWNVAGHRRKFLVASGRYADGTGGLAVAELVFWGEWEPPSRVERRWPASDRLPRVLHRPYWTTPGTTGHRQNTDPWVWGEQMLYTNCKQIVGPDRRATSMQRLTPGSVICFGSTIGEDFCLDTVFVVGSAEAWIPAKARALDLSEAFVTCTADSVVASPTDAHLELTLYRGATVDAPIEGMFSFAPARRADDAHQRFARPAVRVAGLINPANKQSTWGSKRPLEGEQVREAWQALVRQVLARDLVLGVSFEIPTHLPGDYVPAGGRGRC